MAGQELPWQWSTRASDGRGARHASRDEADLLEGVEQDGFELAPWARLLSRLHLDLDPIDLARLASTLHFGHPAIVVLVEARREPLRRKRLGVTIASTQNAVQKQGVLVSKGGTATGEGRQAMRLVQACSRLEGLQCQLQRPPLAPSQLTFSARRCG